MLHFDGPRGAPGPGGGRRPQRLVGGAGGGCGVGEDDILAGGVGELDEIALLELVVALPHEAESRDIRHDAFGEGGRGGEREGEGGRGREREGEGGRADVKRHPA